MLPDLGPKLGAFPQPSACEDLLEPSPALGWRYPSSWGRRLAAQASVRAGSGCGAWSGGASWTLPAMTLMGHRWSCPATSWPPQLWDLTGSPHWEPMGSPTSFPQVLSHLFPACYAQRAFPTIPLQSCRRFLCKTQTLYFFFHLVLVHVLVQCSFLIPLFLRLDLPLHHALATDCTSCCSSSSWSLSLALPLSGDGIHAWYFHSRYAGTFLSGVGQHTAELCQASSLDSTALSSSSHTCLAVPFM